jgi:hypothetical protein
VDCSTFLETALHLAPMITASIAAAAAFAAWRAVYVQRDIARRRAAIDFFMKTEMDPTIMDLYEVFKREIKAVVNGAPMHTVVSSADYLKVRGFLNICELIAVGVRRKAFSEHISFHYWGDVLLDGFSDAKPLIDHVREQEGRPATYVDLQWLCEEKWKDRV